MTELPKELHGLTSRQRLFVINLVSGMTQTDAYVKAGYSPVEAGSNAVTLLNGNQSVNAAYNALLKRRDSIALDAIENTVASPLEVKQVLTSVLRGNIKTHINAQGEPELGTDSIPVKEYSHRRRIDHEGNPVVSKEIKLESKLEAARELAKIHGMYAPSKHLVAQRVQFEIVHTERLKTQE